MKPIFIIIILIAVAIIAAGAFFFFPTQPPEDVERAQVSSPTATEQETINTEGSAQEAYTVVLQKTDDTVEQENTQETPVTVNTDTASLEFIGFGPGKEHPGTFGDIRAELQFVEGVFSGGELRLSPATVNTGIGALDSHLQKEEFFDTENHTEVLFTVTSVEFTNETTANISGNLTLRGITKSLTFPATITDSSITTDFIIDISEFGISVTGVNNEVQIKAFAEWTSSNE